MSRVLITGGLGFVGSNLARALAEGGDEVRIFDNRSSIDDVYVRDLGLQIVGGDVTDARAVLRATRGVDAVVHLAAQAGVAPSVENPRRDFEQNVLGTFNVLDAARRAEAGRVVFASSGAVLAGARPPLNEAIPLQPLSPYGASKAYGEVISAAFESVYGIVCVPLRFSNVYGPYSAHKKSVVATFLRRAMRKKSLLVYGTGRQTRDFLFVGDVVEAIRRALEAKGGGTLQLGTGVETSVNELVRAVREVIDPTLEVERKPPRPGEAARNVSDITRARRVLRWKPRVDLREGLAATYEWMRAWSG